MTRAIAIVLALAVTGAGAHAQPWPDHDRATDHDPSAGCRAIHALGPAAAPTCPRFTRVTARAIELVAPIEFDLNKATLRPRTRPLLDELAAQLRAHPGLRIEIRGHFRDEQDRARRLSDDRARAVRAYLIERGGVAGDRLEAHGYGASMPRVRPADDHRNWRIEVFVIP